VKGEASDDRRIGRREVLRGATVGVAGSAVMACLEPVRQAFAEALTAGVPVADEPLDPVELGSAYTLDPAITYFNHGSMGTIPRAVQQARAGYLAVCETNPWAYMWGGEWEAPREAVRAQAASFLGVAAEEVAVTHNTTEAFNLLAHGLPLGAADEVLFSSLNHPGASLPFQHMAAERGYTVRRFDFPLERLPELTTEEVVELHASQIREATRVLVLPHVDNLVGLRHPVAEIAAAARDRGVEWVAVDGAQAVGMLPVDVGALGVDVYATSPHKWLQAPKGLGLAWVHRGLIGRLRAMWVTWGQQRWAGTARIYEDYGTRNLPELLALGDALTFQQRLGAEHKEQHYRALWQHCRAAVEETPGLSWLSPTDWSLSASLYAVGVEGLASNELFSRLWPRHGYVLRPFTGDGLNSLRLSLNAINHPAQLDRFFHQLRVELG
jgi:selenocysteine lyase/cysteine desulfurase